MAKEPQRRAGPQKGAAKVRHERALQMLLEGHTQVSIAKELGVLPQTVSAWLRDPDFVAELDRRREALSQDAYEILREATSAAALTLVNAAKTGDIKAACEILDRTGLPKTTRQELEHTHVDALSDDELEDEVKRLLEEELN